MKKVLILSGSPRKGGNSDILCDRFAKGAALGYAYTYMLWTVVIGGLPTALAMTLAHFFAARGRRKRRARA